MQASETTALATERAVIGGTESRKAEVKKSGAGSVAMTSRVDKAEGYRGRHAVAGRGIIGGRLERRLVWRLGKTLLGEIQGGRVSRGVGRRLNIAFGAVPAGDVDGQAAGPDEQRDCQADIHRHRAGSRL
jgi:hypothetical protein